MCLIYIHINHACNYNSIHKLLFWFCYVLLIKKHCFDLIPSIPHKSIFKSRWNINVTTCCEKKLFLKKKSFMQHLHGRHSKDAEGKTTQRRVERLEKWKLVYVRVPIKKSYSQSSDGLDLNGKKKKNPQA